MANAALKTKPETKQEKAKQVPQPTGYHVLVAIPGSEEKTEGGIYKPDAVRRDEQILATYGVVIALGPDAYKDPKKFPGDPWVKEGDFALFRPYAGTRLLIHGRHFRLLNDDAIEGTVEDPRGIKQ